MPAMQTVFPGLQDYDFDLPPSSIALRPAEPRDAARLLQVCPHPFHLHDRLISTLPTLLKPGDVLVLNETKVLPAQLSGYRLGENGQRIAVSLTLLAPGERECWMALARPGKKLKPGDIIELCDTQNSSCAGGEGKEAFQPVQSKAGSQPLAQTKHQAKLKIMEKMPDGFIAVQPSTAGQPDMHAIMQQYGQPPLPPYIASKRQADDQDRLSYQTIYARKPGAIAAPTAGLHFTDRLFSALKARGVTKLFVTLHVGAGTFLPLRDDPCNVHKLHAEYGEISPETARAINAARQAGGRIISAGTTTLRLLESACNGKGAVQPFQGYTDIFIKPGHAFCSADLLLTNFLLPQSTLFMLVCAFSGTATMQSAYRHAIASGYRFYSYGDACLLHRAANQTPDHPYPNPHRHAEP
jgi:S-adenosylmethionine:tRNA ribosyltransferase-isomerase